MTGEPRKRTLGLAAILVVSALTGFLAAAGTSGAQYATVGTIAESQAFEMPVEQEDQRVKFALEADRSTTTDPTATFALYDPADGFFTEFELTGEGDEAEAILGQTGSWVLFVTEQRNAELQVQYETGGEDSVELASLAVTEERTTVAEQDGGSLDEQVAFRVDHRPASAFLAFEGDIEDLDAQVTSEQGPVYELTDASANASEDGARSGEVTVTSANLATGTYEVTAEATAFDGELAFVHQTYERASVNADEDAGNEANVTYEEAHEGEVVTELEAGQAEEVSTASAPELTFLAEEDTRATLMVYNGSDRLVDRIEIDGQQSEWNWSGDANETRFATVETLALPEPGDYVLYAKDVRPSEASIEVFVADEAAQADSLEVQTQEATLEGNEDGWNTTMDGALVEITAQVRDTATTDRNVTATGEAGTVLHYEQAWNTFGATISHTHEEHPERFTSGEITVSMDANGFGGQTDVELVHYVR